MTQSKNTTHHYYQQLQLDERGQIEAFHKQGMSIRQIAQVIRRNPSTIAREIRRGTAIQIDSQRHCTYSAYFAETGVHSVDSFVHWFKQQYPDQICPSTPTVYRYIDDNRLALRNQDLPMKIRRKAKYYGRRHHRINKKILGQSIELRSSVVENYSEFGH